MKRDEDQEEPTMWNKKYQESRYRYSKLLERHRLNDQNCCNHCWLGIFKNLIYVFLLIIVISFATMIYIVNSDNDFDEEYQS